MKKQYPTYGHRTSTLHRKITKEEKSVLSDYEKHLSTTASPGKVQQNIKFVLQFRDVVEKPCTKVNRVELETFWGLVKMSEYEYNTKVMIKRGVKRFIKWYYKDLSLIEGLKVGDFKANRKKINKSVLLKPHEIQSMLHAAQTLRDKTLLILLYESAARPQELKDLKWKDIDWDEKEVHLDSSKTERDRDLPIEESLLHLRRWKQEWAFPDVIEDDYIFPSRWRERKLTTEHVNNIVKKLASRAGIKRNITAYTFRHSRLRDVYISGVKGLEHNKFAGHKEGSKQQGLYTHIDNNDMKEDVLKKVYHVEDLSLDKRHKLEKDVADIKAAMNVMQAENLALKGMALYHGIKPEEGSPLHDKMQANVKKALDHAEKGAKIRKLEKQVEIKSK